MDSNTTRLMGWFKAEMRKRLEITESEDSWLKVRVERDREAGWLRMDLVGYTENLIAKYADDSAQHPLTSLPRMTVNQITRPVSAEEAATYASYPFEALKGELQYLSQRVRRDILAVVGMASSRISYRSKSLWDFLMLIVRYLKGTANMGHFIERVEDPEELVIWVDSDYGADEETRRSTYGYVTKLGGAVVSCTSRKAGHVARGTMEAEYNAVAHGVSDALFVSRLVAELGAPLAKPPVIFCDNKAAVELAHHPVKHQASKHIDVAYMFAREHVEAGRVVVTWVPGRDNVADLMTKWLPREAFCKWREALGLRFIPVRGSVGSGGSGGVEGHGNTGG